MKKTENKIHKNQVLRKERGFEDNIELNSLQAKLQAKLQKRTARNRAQ